MHGYFGSKVSGSTIGIVGLGRIGSAVAKRSNGFGMKVLYHNRNRRKADEKKLGKILCSCIQDVDPLLNTSPLIVKSATLFKART